MVLRMAYIFALGSALSQLKKLMFDQLQINQTVIQPAIFCGPMAGISHSAFRRLVADFGGYGAQFTEMLSGPALLHENLARSPFTKKRAYEGRVIYQLRLNGEEHIAAVIERLKKAEPFALDINLGCPAPEIIKMGAGVALFSNAAKLDKVLKEIRLHWDGNLTIKCRLGTDEKKWRGEFEKRLGIFESHNVNALFVHPRFFNEKLKRTSRWRYAEWIAQQTSIPVIVNGDIISRESLERCHEQAPGAKGVMIARAAVAQPWIFARLSGRETMDVDFCEVWQRFYRYVCEDFIPEKAIGRLKEFTAYYSRNFFFGHTLSSSVQAAKTLDALFKAAQLFLSANPQAVKQISVSGI